ncbi:hypothetical protein EYF80_016410 [Liparis tanakae]|uniref:Uncharacterized protein n=1 Tax=Liparis tanakae TaxID=230148 RepID=A0A4Z2I5F5_9TELE|nr:hypothetical protein EYF80_016410 [Liparis tanakae]
MKPKFEPPLVSLAPCIVIQFGLDKTVLSDHCDPNGTFLPTPPSATSRCVLSAHSKMSVQWPVCSINTSVRAASGRVCGGTSAGFSGHDRPQLIKPPSDAGGNDHGRSRGNALRPCV